MNQPTTLDAAAAASADDQEIRKRAKGLTSQVLQQGRVDPDAVREIVRAVIGGTPSTPAAASSADARDMFAEAVRTLDEALVKSASETHHALQQLATRGKDFTDNDLKEALVSLRRLEQDYAATASRIGEAMSTNLRREMAELAVHAQNVGVEASARVAGLLGQFAGAIGAAPGIATARGATARVTLAFSGLLAGVADALRDQPKAKSDT
jgi:uncharacterized protein DUF6781